MSLFGVEFGSRESSYKNTISFDKCSNSASFTMVNIFIFNFTWSKRGNSLTVLQIEAKNNSSSDLSGVSIKFSINSNFCEFVSFISSTKYFQVSDVLFEDGIRFRFSNLDLFPSLQNFLVILCWSSYYNDITFPYCI